MIDYNKIAGQVLDTEIKGLADLKAALLADPSFGRAIELLLKRRGAIVVTGMGKSGHIAKKIATTMSSTGSRAFFLHPGEASHGDMSIISSDEVIIAISNSGESRELSDIVGYAKRFGVPLISITRAADSTLARAADVSLVMPAVPECCVIGKAPTTSMVQTLALGDVLTVVLENANALTPDMYKNWHPGGKLGASLIRVSDLMHSGDEVPVCGEDDTFEMAIAVMGRPVRFGCVGVVDAAGKMAGILTDGDIRRQVASGLAGKKMRDIMKKSPFTVRADLIALDALRILNEKQIQTLFILDDASKPIGIINFHDLLKAGIA
ncbi:MAG: KpsF/GutQ family sugar-phosphate isomerase [Alphaproteobacteria bacterium]|nr:KpsF/GutQ family sugar-phosphate isomerase [Alphaproteobacteria bacterium]